MLTLHLALSEMTDNTIKLIIYQKTITCLNKFQLQIKNNNAKLKFKLKLKFYAKIFYKTQT